MIPLLVGESLPTPPPPCSKRCAPNKYDIDLLEAEGESNRWRSKGQRAVHHM